MGLLFVRGLSTGGTDLLSLLLANRIHDVPVGTLLLCVDGAVVVIAVLIFRDIDVALYSAITIFVASKVVDNMATLSVERSMPWVFLNSSHIYLVTQASKSSPPRRLLPAVASTSITPSPISRMDTSKVPPPRS